MRRHLEPPRPRTTYVNASSLARRFVSLAPWLFTAGWLWSGARTPDIPHGSRSISALGSAGQPFPWPTLAGQALQGTAQLVNADLARRAGLRSLSAALAATGAGTLVATATPLAENAGGGVHRAHTVAAGVGMVAFHLAPAIGAADPRLAPTTRRLGVAALATALPASAFFTHHLRTRGNEGPGYGWSERIFLTVLLAWTTVAPRGYPRTR